jgi:cytochrome c oxidase subunit 2
MTWTVIPFIISMVIFFWGARLYFNYYRPPADALEIRVIGKQWMWKIQHPDGTREINTLHVPLNQNVRLTLASQDVIHSFYMPEMRVKQDAVPGRYSVLWFKPTKVGTYHLFCAEYCGTLHSGMIGKVVVMEPDAYQQWLSGSVPGERPAESGAKLFDKLGCRSCHGVQAPSLAGVFGTQVKLSDGSTVLADENYIRQSILDSTSQIVEGFPPIMPSFRGQVSEEQLMDLTAYIKSLAVGEQAAGSQSGASGVMTGPGPTTRNVPGPSPEHPGAGSQQTQHD